MTTPSKQILEKLKKRSQRSFQEPNFDDKVREYESKVSRILDKNTRWIPEYSELERIVCKAFKQEYRR